MRALGTPPLTATRACHNAKGQNSPNVLGLSEAWQVEKLTFIINLRYKRKMHRERHFPYSRRRWLVIGSATGLLLILGCLGLLVRQSNRQADLTHVSPEAPTGASSTVPYQEGSVANVSSEMSKNNGIIVTSPKANELVQLPLTVQGYINGNGWFANEGEAGSVQVLDANGKAVSNVAVLMTTTDWLKLPTRFEAIVGDREMTSSIQTATGFISISSEGEKDGDQLSSIAIPIRFR